MTSYTTNLNLAKPPQGDTDWGREVNGNWDTLDTQEASPYYGKLTRYSASQIKLSGRENTPQFVEVNGSSIDISTAKTVDVGASPDNLIEGGSPSASTLYNVYLSDNGNLRLSATSPNSYGYRTGDSSNRFVGAVYLDASTEVADEYNLCGIMQRYRSYEEPSQITRSSGSAGYYDMVEFENVVLLPNTMILAMGAVNMKEESGDGNIKSRLYIDSTSDAAYCEFDVSSGQTHTCVSSIAYLSTTVQTKDVHCEYYYDSGTVIVWSDSKLEIVRATP